MAKQKAKAKAEAVQALQDICPKGTSIRAILIGVSASGMSRTLRLFFVDADGALRDITRLSALAVGWPMKKGECLRVTGCGLDVGLHAVDTLAYAVWGKPAAQGRYQWSADTQLDTYHWGGWF